MKLLHFANADTEYLVLTEEPKKEWAGYARPGFELMTACDVEGNVSGLPMETEFVKH